ncbi:Pls/PosA family non-ribosomal peptide synthetase [Aestuariivirga litoralis]|uniref:Pls/PosA family non-ribosomal peptide synthetase n=1 Tax=Aestuariivirga litoralis TaxID=2650924 RepID=UPI0018C6F7AE|nr:Pls/PosA family non-ribosomal peptide synthetase [Aestuariivirga litoralis]MBG1230794.1 amino acid adenylation domain-containing protein [Aestuariivirga litoralis]
MAKNTKPAAPRAAKTPKLAFQLKGPSHPEFLKEEVLADIFRHTAKARPKAIAITSGDRHFTYAEVDMLSDQIAAELMHRGALPGKVVGLYFTRGVNLLIAQIAITKTGATWLPFDSETPKDRMATCLADCDAIALLVDEDVEDRVEGLGHPVWSVSDAAFNQKLDKPLARAKGHTPDHHAYLIYTSGSTGTPKGIAITHRNICHYLRACNSIFGINAKDVMFQGCSAAFDLSMEEIWVPYLAGASLWVATPQILADTENLPRRMREAGVTAIDTVPTLLSMFAEDVESLRVIIVGGEACPPSLVERFADKKGRKLFNSYGPTETTVVATIAELRKGDPVTIGTPIANYTAYVVDDNLQPVAPGQQGELLIGGPGVASGYLGRKELTAQKFIANPFDAKAEDKILYRSGDAVAIDAKGRILFQGRIDDQVKIRGFRVELGEIETAILQEDQAAEHVAVVLRKDHGLDRLVAFIAPRKGASPNLNALRETLRKRLPPYMVPAAFEIIAEVPRLTSGKVDRKSLRAMPLAISMADESQSDIGENPVEDMLIECAQAIFPGQPITRHADFFTDLGGHSLLAAQFISKVRLDKFGEAITLQDMYNSRTVANIAKALIERGALENASASEQILLPARPTFSRRFWCGLAQGVTLPFLLMLQAAPWLAIFITYSVISPDEATFAQDVWQVFVSFMLVTLFDYMIVPVLKFLILPKTKPGVYPLWGFYYYRVWLVQRLLPIVHLKWMQGTPIIRFYLRLLGAKVGKDALIDNIQAGAIDLVTIGDHASLGGKLIVNNTRAVGDKFIIGTVEIGNDVLIGSSCVIENDVVIGAGAQIGDLTSVGAGSHIPAWESWTGSPAQKIADVDPLSLPPPADAPRWVRNWQTAFYALLLVILPPLSIVPIVPTFRMIEALDAWSSDWLAPILGVSEVNSDWFYFLLALPASFAMVILSCILIVAIRWTVLPSLKAGRYSVFSNVYIRKWIVALTIEVMLDSVYTIFATIYMRTWYRLLGTKIGPGTEVSTNLGGRYDLVELGSGNFIADDVQLGGEDLHRNWMTLGTIKTGDKVFIGNEAVIPMNYIVESGALIGVKSRPPEGGGVGASEIWFGSPAIKLPVRQTFAGTDATTFKPKWYMLVGRALFEAFNIAIPTAMFITLVTYGMELVSDELLEGSWTDAIFMCFVVMLGIDAAQIALAVVVKWLLMGRYRPTIKPMWSWWAMRTEAVSVMFWGMAGKSILDEMRGTPFLPMLLRLFGTKIGKGVYMDTDDITEFDCVTIGDYTCLNMGASLQTHLYEDRLMKVGRIKVGNDVTVGAGSIVLYDTRIGDNAQIGPLTLVMKGEALPARSSWVGSPAQPMKRSKAKPVSLEVAAAAAA